MTIDEFMDDIHITHKIDYIQDMIGTAWSFTTIKNYIQDNLNATVENIITNIPIDESSLKHELQLQWMNYFEDPLPDEDVNNLITDLLQNETFIQALNGVIRRIKRQVEFKNNSNDHGVNDVDELIDNNDKIGDILKLTNNFDVDRTVRDKPFLYYNDRIFIGNAGEIHMDIIKREIINTDTYNLRARSVEDLPGIDNNAAIAFGHIYKNMAFIETCENCSYENVYPKLKKYNFDKIYDYNYTGHTLKRLARKIK